MFKIDSSCCRGNLKIVEDEKGQQAVKKFKLAEKGICSQ